MAQFVDVALAFLSFSFRLFLFQFHYGEEPSALEVHIPSMNFLEFRVGIKVWPTVTAAAS